MKDETIAYNLAWFTIVTGVSLVLFGFFFLLTEGSPLFTFIKIGGVVLALGVIMAYVNKAGEVE